MKECTNCGCRDFKMIEYTDDANKCEETYRCLNCDAIGTQVCYDYRDTAEYLGSIKRVGDDL